MKRLFTFIYLSIAAATLMAQAPRGYYDGTEGLTGDDLKAALHNIIKNDNHVSYNGMWTAYQTTDKRPGTNYVWDIYSDVPSGTPPFLFTFSTDQCGSYQGEGDCYNREHLWAQSWTNNDGTHKTDLHHVYPTDGFVNGKRDNYAFGEVRNATWTSENGSKLGSCRTSGFNGTVFEPIDEYKGDIARALMYVSVRYYQEDSNWDISDMTNKSVIKDWAMTMLLRWHEDDPVSEKEINRNNAVYGKQNNRNPFVDNPEFAEMIWDPNWTHHYYVISVSANPSIAGTVSGAGTYKEGQSCTLTATANWGYSFVNWTRNGIVVSNSEVYSFTVTSEATYQANFEINTYEISVAANPEEGGDVLIGDASSSKGTYMASIDFSQQGYTNGQELNGVTIGLDDNVSVVFNKNTGSTTPKYYTSGTSVRCYGGNNFVVSTANGSISSITLTYASGGGSNAITTNVATFNGTTWNGDATSVTFTIGGTSNHRRIKGISVTYTIEDSPTHHGTFTHGSVATIIATPNDGYYFVNWTKDNEVISTDATYSFAVTEDAEYIANFAIPENYIEFADANVEAICVANWDTDGSGKLSYEEAAAVTSLGAVFKNKQNIVSFDELQYFTGLTAIEETAFMFCINLTNISLPNSVISIGRLAFDSCSSLTTITIPNSVTTIGNGAFGDCDNLTSIAIPYSVTSIGVEAFAYCNSMSQMVVDSGNTVYDSRDNCDAIIETATNKLISGCKNTVIPNSVTSIGECAFEYCFGLTSIEIPNAVTSIGVSAFAYCSGLTSVIMGESLTTIEMMAFYNCDNLTTIFIPNSVAYIGSIAFSACNNLSEIIVEEDNTIYDSRDNCNAIIETATNKLVVGCKSTEIPNSVTVIGNSAFDSCSGLTSITIPNSVTTIENYAFYYCSGLTSMTVLSNTPPSFILYNVANDVFKGIDKSIPVYVTYGTLDAYQSADGWNEFTNYQELPPVSVTQNISLAQGSNWVSFSVEITLEDLQSALVNALGNNSSIAIKSKTQNTKYNNGRWVGQLKALDMSQMYIITVDTCCSITLDGMRINPAELSITITNGSNWIAFPFDEGKTVTEAFGSFPVDGDQVKSKTGNTKYNRGRWVGQLTTLEPGAGYIYVSASDEERTLTF